MKPGKSVEIPEKKTILGIYMRGIPEKNTDTADDRLRGDLKKIETVLEFLRVEDRKLTKAQ